MIVVKVLKRSSTETDTKRDIGCTQGRRNSGRGKQLKSRGQWKPIKNKKLLPICFFPISNNV